MPQEFPMMIYHIQLGQKIVNDESEVQLYEGRGWIRDYQVFQKKNTLGEKIKYHRSELNKLEAENKKYIVTDSESVTITDDVLTDKAKPTRGRP